MTRTKRQRPNPVGMRFGRLTVTADSGRRAADGSVLWRCVCECGRQADRTLAALRRSKLAQCGQWDHTLIGQRFGRLTIVAYAGGGDQGSRFECVCDCGNTCVVGVHEMRRGNTLSCGCGMLESRKRNVREAKARVNVDGTRLDGLDNKPYRNSATGLRGVVVYTKDRSKYQASISFRGRTYSLGVYRTLHAAWDARRKAERLLFDTERLRHGMDPISDDEAVARFIKAVKRIREAGREDGGKHAIDESPQN